MRKIELNSPIHVKQTGSRWKVSQKTSPVSIESRLSRDGAISLGIYLANKYNLELVVHNFLGYIDFKYNPTKIKEKYGKT